MAMEVYGTLRNLTIDQHNSKNVNTWKPPLIVARTSLTVNYPSTGPEARQKVN